MAFYSSIWTGSVWSYVAPSSADERLCLLSTLKLRIPAADALGGAGLCQNSHICENHGNLFFIQWPLIHFCTIAYNS